MIWFAIAAADSGQDTSFFQREPSPVGGRGEGGEGGVAEPGISWFPFIFSLIRSALYQWPISPPQAPDVLEVGTLKKSVKAAAVY